MSESAVLLDSLQRLKTWLAQHAPEIKIDPATIPGLPDALATAPGAQDILTLWSVAGQCEGYGQVATPRGPFSLISPDESQETRGIMEQVQAEELEDGEMDERFYPAEWIPFASDGSGDDVVVNAVTREVRHFDHEERADTLLAPDLPTFFADQMQKIEAGELVWNADWGIVPPDWD